MLIFVEFLLILCRCPVFTRSTLNINILCTTIKDEKKSKNLLHQLLSFPPLCAVSHQIFAPPKNAASRKSEKGERELKLRPKAATEAFFSCLCHVCGAWIAIHRQADYILRCSLNIHHGNCPIDLQR